MTDARPQLFHRILVGADGSSGSGRAIEWSAIAATATKAEVLVVHVLTYSHEFNRDLSISSLRTWRRDLERDLKTRWVEPLQTAGVEFRCMIVEGDSGAQALVDVADREAVDVIVVGSRGHANLSERVLGGMAYRLSHRASQPVVVVPPGWSPTGS